MAEKQLTVAETESLVDKVYKAQRKLLLGMQYELALRFPEPGSFIPKLHAGVQIDVEKIEWQQRLLKCLEQPIKGENDETVE